MKIPKKPNRIHGTLAEREAIAKRFKDFRVRMHLTQRELASLIGLCDGAGVSDIEQAKHLPHHSTMKSFMQYENRTDKEMRGVR